MRKSSPHWEDPSYNNDRIEELVSLHESQMNGLEHTAELLRLMAEKQDAMALQIELMDYTMM